MGVIVEHKQENVTLGVTDKDLRIAPELTQTTFTDVFGTLHTVFAHRDGPFKTAEEIVAAFENGTLHTFETHEKAAAFERDRGNREFAAKLDSLTKSSKDNARTDGGDYQ